jgi:hypothetical protein
MKTNYLEHDQHDQRMRQCAKTATSLLAAGIIFGLMYTFFPDSNGLRALCITSCIANICFCALAAYHYIKARRAISRP